MSIQNRVERFDSFFADGRILRGAWTGKDQEGRETACLLAALSSEVADEQDPSACPADVLPAWLAHVVPLVDDNTTEGYWPEAMCRFSDCLHLIAEAQPTKEQWRRIEARWLVSVIDEAKRHTDSDDAIAACDVVRGLLMRAATGDEPTAIEWGAAAARAAAWNRMAASLFDAIEVELLAVQP